MMLCSLSEYLSYHEYHVGRKLVKTEPGGPVIEKSQTSLSSRVVCDSAWLIASPPIRPGGIFGSVVTSGRTPGTQARSWKLLAICQMAPIMFGGVSRAATLCVVLVGVASGIVSGFGSASTLALSLALTKANGPEEASRSAVAAESDKRILKQTSRIDAFCVSDPIGSGVLKQCNNSTSISNLGIKRAKQWAEQMNIDTKMKNKTHKILISQSRKHMPRLLRLCPSSPRLGRDLDCGDAKNDFQHHLPLSDGVNDVKWKLPHTTASKFCNPIGGGACEPMRQPLQYSRGVVGLF